MIDLVWGLDLSLYQNTADLICIKSKKMPPDHKRSIRMHVSLSTCDPLGRIHHVTLHSFSCCSLPPSQSVQLPYTLVFAFKFPFCVTNKWRAASCLFNTICPHLNRSSVLAFIPSWKDPSSFKGYSQPLVR